MTIEEIRESGILEQYAMGVLTELEVREVEGYLTEFPQLQQDYFEIQNALQALVTEKSITPRASLEDELIKSVLNDSPISKAIEKIRNQESSNDFLRVWKLISGLLTLCAIAAFYFYSQLNTKYKDHSNEFDTYKLECDSIVRSQQETLDLFNQLNNKENRVLNVTPTAGYPETQLLFHFNVAQKKNYIQVQNLPTIASNQVFQLWSLKPGLDPIPLNIFKDVNDIFVPVDFEEGTGTYAITIENEGGSLVPTLDRLIGTVGV